jgi:hypothetical protein
MFADMVGGGWIEATRCEVYVSPLPLPHPRLCITLIVSVGFIVPFIAGHPLARFLPINSPSPTYTVTNLLNSDNFLPEEEREFEHSSIVVPAALVQQAALEFLV